MLSLRKPGDHKIPMNAGRVFTRPIKLKTARTFVRECKQADPARYATVSVPAPPRGARIWGVFSRIGRKKGPLVGTFYAVPHHGGTYLGGLCSAPGWTGLVAWALRALRYWEFPFPIQADCYSPLVPVYESHGARLLSRAPWNPEFAPADWPEELGTPDFCEIAWGS